MDENPDDPVGDMDQSGYVHKLKKAWINEYTKDDVDQDSNSTSANFAENRVPAAVEEHGVPAAGPALEGQGARRVDHESAQENHADKDRSVCDMSVIPTSEPTKEPKPKQRTLFDFQGFSGNANPKNDFAAKKRVICPECGDIIGTKGSLFNHMKFKHKKEPNTAVTRDASAPVVTTACVRTRPTSATRAASTGSSGDQQGDEGGRDAVYDVPAAVERPRDVADGFEGEGVQNTRGGPSTDDPAAVERPQDAADDVPAAVERPRDVPDDPAVEREGAAQHGDGHSGAADDVSAAVERPRDIPDDPAAEGAGQNEPKRRYFTYHDKAIIIEQFFEFQDKIGEASFRDLEKEFGVPKSTLQRWIKQKDTINARALDETLRNLSRYYPTKRHNATYPHLYKVFQKARKAGKKVSFKWLWVKGIKIAHEKEFPRFTRYATQTFIKRYGIRIRRVQRKKQHEKEHYEPKLQDFHSNYREGLIKSGKNKPHFDQKWGRFKPSRRFNLDQVRISNAFLRILTYFLRIYTFLTHL